MAKDITIHVRISDTDRERWNAEADKEDMTMSEWVRWTINSELKRREWERKNEK